MSVFFPESSPSRAAQPHHSPIGPAALQSARNGTVPAKPQHPARPLPRQARSQTAGFKSWSGYAFENVCLKHLPQIRKALGISGIYSEASSFSHPGNKHEKGFQIDLVLDRKDQTINLFEFKFHTAALSLDKSDAAALRERMEAFRQVSKTKKHLFLSFLTTFGVKANEHSLGLVDHNLEAGVLFEA